MLAWTGGLINAVQTTMYALAAHVYPTAIRATGVGTAVAFGRIGGVAQSVGRVVGARIGGPAQIFRLHRRDAWLATFAALGRRPAVTFRRVVGARLGAGGRGAGRH